MMHVTFAELASVLQASSATVDAAEGHGCLCGALCTNGDYSIELWLAELIPDEDRQLEDRDEQVLRLIFDETVRALRGDAMEFVPLLPEEDDSLERRATTLAQWCQGFLYGFGTGGTLPGAIPATVSEVLRDVAQIGGAAVDTGAAGEEEEEAYAEVFEYLRVGVQLVHDELAAVREGTQGPPDTTVDDDNAACDDQIH